MKIGLALPHLGPDATKENIIKLTVDAEKEALTLFGLLKGLFGL